MASELCDCHLHTELSGDSELHLPWVLSHATILGLRGVCPAEHYDPAPADPRFAHIELDGIFVRHRRLTALFPDVALGVGLEVTYRQECEDEIRRTLAAHQFDLVIGSVHDLEGLYLREWLMSQADDHRSPRDRLRPYLELTLSMVRSRIFGILGHLDYVKRYQPDLAHGSFLAMFQDEIIEILRTHLQGGGVLELNVSGLRHPCRECYPSNQILALYRTLGGDAVTLASDAHSPRHYDVPLLHGAAIAEASGLRVIDWRSL